MELLTVLDHSSEPLSASHITDPDSGDELLIRSHQIRWSRGAVTQRVFSVDRAGGPLLNAVWATFEPAQRHICALQRDMITVFAEDGELRKVPLPFQARRMWALERGLLIARQVSKAEKSATNAQPNLFSLMHSLEELKPVSHLPTAVPDMSFRTPPPAINHAVPSFVSARRPSRSGSVTAPPSSNNVAGAFFADPLEQPVWCCRSQPFILTHHSRTGRHALYIVRQSRWEVVKRQLAHSSSHRLSKHRQPDVTHQPLIVPPTESDITSELVLELLWRSDSMQPPASHVFLASELDHTPLLCVHSAASARLFALELRGHWTNQVGFAGADSGASHHGLSVNFSWERSGCATAVALHSLRAAASVSRTASHLEQPYHHDILQLDATGSLSLWAGKHCLHTSLPLPRTLLLELGHDSHTQSVGLSVDRVAKKRASFDALSAEELAMELDLEDMKDSDSHSDDMDQSEDSAVSGVALIPNHVRIRALGDASGHSFTIMFATADGIKPVRIRMDNVVLGAVLSLPSESKSLVRDVWAALQAAADSSKKHQSLGCLMSEFLRNMQTDSNRSDCLKWTRSEQFESPAWTAFCQTLISSIVTPGASTFVSAAQSAPPSNAWLNLLQSDYHRQNSKLFSWLPARNDESEICSISSLRCLSRSTSPLSVDDLIEFFGALHLLHEAALLNTLRPSVPLILARLLIRVALLALSMEMQPQSRNWWTSHIAYYSSTYEPRQLLLDQSDVPTAAETPASVFSVYRFATFCVARSTCLEDRHVPALALSGPPAPFDAVRQLCLYYDVLFPTPSVVRQDSTVPVSSLAAPPIQIIITAAEKSRGELVKPMSFGSPLMLTKTRGAVTPSTPFASPVVRRRHRAPPASSELLSPAHASSSHIMLTPPPASTDRQRSPLAVTLRREFPLFSPNAPDVDSSSDDESATHSIQHNPLPISTLPHVAARALLDELVSEGVTSPSDLLLWPAWMAAPLLQALHVCANAGEDSRTGLSPAHCALLNRHDWHNLAVPLHSSAEKSLSALNSNNHGIVGRQFKLPLHALSVSAATHVGSDAADGKSNNQTAAAASQSKTNVNVESLDEECGDGTATVVTSVALRFGKDQRLKEVRRLLGSNYPVNVVISEDASSRVADHDRANMIQRHLFVLLQRQWASCFGRGAFTLRSTSPLPTQNFPIVPLNIKGSLAPLSTPLKLEWERVGVVEDFIKWCEFHNGCAAGLRLMPAALGNNDSLLANSTRVARSWILYQRPLIPSYSAQATLHSQTHAGLLLALGIGGHLKHLAPSDLIQYLASRHVPTTVALLMGLGAANIGSADATVSRTLCCHLPALPPMSSLSLDVPRAVQTAALFGLAMLYQGTGHRFITLLLIHELARRASTDRQIDRESSVWTAGYALGCIALGRGHSLPGIADLHLDAALWHLVEGGEDPFSAPTKTHATQLDIVAGSSVDPARAAAAVAASVHSSLFASSAAFLSTHGAPGATAQMTATAASHAQYQHYAHALGNVSTSNMPNGISSTLGGSKYAAERLSCVQEGPMVNTEMTAPGALVALGLMYLKTDDAALMARMALPQTPDMLDANSRPDFMLLRVWSRAMIGWNSVRPSRQWIWSQAPRVVLATLFPGVSVKSKTGERTAPTWITPDCDPLCMNGRDCDMSHTKDAFESPSRPRMQDETSAKLIFGNSLAGAALALGFRYAGTANAVARTTLIELLLRVHHMRPAVHFSASTASAPLSAIGLPQLSLLPLLPAGHRVDRASLDSWTSACALALACVMAGTGDLDCLRVLRYVRHPLEAESAFSMSAALHMAIGILFLGGGRVSFSRSPAAIAALTASILPRFANSPLDQRLYLQPARHLYAMATESRYLCTFEAEHPQQDVRVEIAIELVPDNQHSGSAKSAAGFMLLTTPCLLPPFETIARIQLRSAVHYPLTLPGGDELRRCGSRICVQRLPSAALLRESALAQEIVSLTLSSKRQSTTPTWSWVSGWSHALLSDSVLHHASHAAELHASISAHANERGHHALTRAWFHRPRHQDDVDSHTDGHHMLHSALSTFVRYFGVDSGNSQLGRWSLAALIHALGSQQSDAIGWGVSLALHVAHSMSHGLTRTDTPESRFLHALWHAWSHDTELIGKLPPPLPSALIARLHAPHISNSVDDDHVETVHLLPRPPMVA